MKAHESVNENGVWEVRLESNANLESLRKVKCDEARPECTPCSRLHYTCDYNPRVSFKDDTIRIIEKVSGKGGGAGPAWNCASSLLGIYYEAILIGLARKRPTKPRLSSFEQADYLPSFASLANDEDRERKAEFKIPGTYYVVANQASFMNLEEDRQTIHEDQFHPPESLHSHEIRGYVRSITQADSPLDSLDETEDVDVSETIQASSNGALYYEFLLKGSTFSLELYIKPLGLLRESLYIFIELNTARLHL